MLIDVELLATIGIILPPAPSVVQGGSSDACVYTRASVRRASGFVLTGKPEVDCITACVSGLLLVGRRSGD